MMRQKRKLTAILCMICMLAGVIVPAQVRVEAAAVEDSDSGADSEPIKDGWNDGHYYKDGEMVTNQLIDNKYVGKDGSVITNKWQKVGKYYYYFGKDGVFYKNKWVDKKTYYVDAKGHRVVNKWKTIGDYTYHFNKNGKKDTNKWIGGRYVDKNGREVKGAVQGSWVGSKFRKSNGSYVKSGSYCINGTYYLFDESGNLKKGNGWTTVQKIFYYVQPDGKVKTNQWINQKLPLSDSYWTDFNNGHNGKFWVNEKGEMVGRKHKTIKWQKVLVVGSSKYPEQYYRVQPKNSKKPAYYQWVKKKGNSTEDYRPVRKATKKTVEAFGIGDADNPWCLQVYNCKVEIKK